MGLLLPEKESSPESVVLAHKVARTYDVTPRVGENDETAPAGVLSTQLWYTAFVQHFDAGTVEERTDVVTMAAGAPLVAV